MENIKSVVKALVLADVVNQIPIYRTVVVCEHTSLRHFDGGKFFISQISPKGNWELYWQRTGESISRVLSLSVQCCQNVHILSVDCSYFALDFGGICATIILALGKREC